MFSRKEFFKKVALPAGLLLGGTILNANSIHLEESMPDFSPFTGTPEEIAQDEAFWFQVQQSFTVDRSLINLNNGGVSPCPNIVLEAMKRYLDYSNKAPVYTMWQILEPERETVRKRLAAMFACDTEEIAITRNASEGLQILELGFDLKAGDEILCCTQDYPRMITTFQQREKRENLKLVQFKVPVPAEDPAEIVRLYEKNITANTKLILVSHVINLTGQIMPVRDIVRMARKRDIPVIVDGAHSFAQFKFNLADLECDYYATSLHKWLLSPIGTGMLFVRKNKIANIWPMTPAPSTMADNIRKFEEIGTHPAANTLAISESIIFHNGIGAERKEARLRYLRDRFYKRLMKLPNVQTNTSLKKEFSCAIGNIGIKGIEPGALAAYFFSKHKIIVTPIGHEECTGLRVTPNIYTTLDEIDMFCDAFEKVSKNGLV
jgi:isopenicillin-N epimerase